MEFKTIPEIAQLVSTLNAVYQFGSPSDFMDMLSSSMMVASKFKCNGPTKSDYVLRAMTLYVDQNTNMSTDAKTTLNTFLMYGNMFIKDKIYESQQKMDYSPKISGCCS